MSRTLLRGFFAAICLLAAAGLHAQDTVKSLPSNHPRKVTPAKDVPAKPAVHPNAAILAGARADAEAADKSQDSQPGASLSQDSRYSAAYTNYQIWNLEHNRKVYEWHHTSSVIIFFVVVFLVLSGVWFSWMQFRMAHLHPVTSPLAVTTSTASQSADGSAEKDSVTEFSASPQGIKIASSAIGVVVLVISMCFFYLYLEKVYPIRVNPSQEPAKQAATTE